MTATKKKIEFATEWPEIDGATEIYSAGDGGGDLWRGIDGELYFSRWLGDSHAEEGEPEFYFIVDPITEAEARTWLASYGKDAEFLLKTPVLNEGAGKTFFESASFLTNGAWANIGKDYILACRFLPEADVENAFKSALGNIFRLLSRVVDDQTKNPSLTVLPYDVETLWRGTAWATGVRMATGEE